LADQKISALGENTSWDDSDLGMGVDVSDTTMAASGTDKKITWANIKATLKTYFDTLYPSGDSAAWEDFSGSVTFGGVTVGNGEIDAKYKQIGKTTFFKLTFKLGSESAITGDISMTLPATAVTLIELLNTRIIGDSTIVDSGTGVFYGHTVISSTTTAKLRISKVDGTYETGAAASSSVPITWTTNDEFTMVGTYEAA